ncbi:MAG TPA: PIN domain-containing protein [Thermodesulfobacteriota bacterium]|nr:PIN domain-containing protein [Thermodesulfobacteriota bacterium]
MNKPRVFLDADVIFAGSAAPTEHSASNLILQMGEIGLIDCITSNQVTVELERNFEKKLSIKLPELRLIMSRSLRVVADPEPEELTPYMGQADTKDLPILVAALKNECKFLLTFNTKDYRPAKESEIIVQRPGDFVKRIREMLAEMFEKPQM